MLKGTPILFALLLVATVTLLLTAATAVRADDDVDLYAVLDLEREKEDSITDRDIKAAFRVLAKKHHPDRGGDAEVYRKVQQAYDVLGDRKRRKVYDMAGHDGLKKYEESLRNPNAGNAGMPDIFAQFFGGQQQQQGGGNRGKNINMVMLVTLEDIYNGAQHTVKLNKQRLCKHCKGSGADDKHSYHKCGHCGGSGHIVQRIQIMPGFQQQVQQPCPHCGGKGKSITKKCHVCHGHKVTRADQLISVDVEVGVPENHELVFEMEADQSPDQLPGDVVFTIQSAPHPVFQRRGNDLIATVRLSLAEALLGFRKELTHLDGHAVVVQERTPVYYGQQRTIKDEGLPVHNVPSEKGNLIVRYEVELPENLSAKDKEQLKAVLP